MNLVQLAVVYECEDDGYVVLLTYGFQIGQCSLAHGLLDVGSQMASTYGTF